MTNRRVSAVDCSRRDWLAAAFGFAGAGLLPGMPAQADTEETTVRRVASIIGATPTMSSRVRLFMPKVFPNGYTVPLAVDVGDGDSEDDRPISIRVLAPQNPLVEVATFHFVPGRAQARVSTRIRLAEPQFVAAVATTSAGKLLMARAWVVVETDGCK